MARGRALALLAAIAAAGCGAPAPSPTPSGSPRPADTLTLAVRADVTGLYPNPPTVNEAYTLHVNANVLEGLTRFDSQLRLQPGLAERWENPDERTYVFHLRPGLRFSDGRPLRAADVAASLLAAQRNNWAVVSYLRSIESVRALDELRVELRTRFPYQILLTKLQWAFVLPAEAVAQTTVPVIGTGPYRIEAWRPGVELRLARNDHYRGARPAFAKARLVVVPDPRERVARLLRGDVDVITDVPLEAVSELRAHPEVRVTARGSLRVLFLNLRPDSPPFRDPRVREAFDLALDRRELVERALSGLTEPATQVVHPSVVGYNPEVRLPVVDRARARQLLEAAGYARGLEVQLDGPNNRYVNDVEILAEVARQLGEIGVRVRVNAEDKAAFFRRISAGASPFHLLGWSCESGEAGDVLDAAFHSAAGAAAGTDNSLGLRDAELDRLIDRSNASTSVSERTRLLQAALARIARLRVALPLVEQAEAVAMSRRIRWDPPLNSALLLFEVFPAVPNG